MRAGQGRESGYMPGGATPWWAKRDRAFTTSGGEASGQEPERVSTGVSSRLPHSFHEPS
jgi:hypothetical protein